MKQFSIVFKFFFFYIENMEKKSNHEKNFWITLHINIYMCVHTVDTFYLKTLLCEHPGIFNTFQWSQLNLNHLIKDELFVFWTLCNLCSTLLWPLLSVPVYTPLLFKMIICLQSEFASSTIIEIRRNFFRKKIQWIRFKK